MPSEYERAGRTGRRLQTVLVGLAMLAALAATVVWPGDIDYTFDPPALIINAFIANEQHVPAGRGLSGNFGLAYGPLPTHVYQLLLLLTGDDLVAVAAWRAALCSGMTGLSLLWLARTLRLSPWFAVAVLFAPYVNYYHRALWDASFAVPIGSLALAAYAAFLRTPTRGPLLIATAATLALLLIHPQDLPVVAALAGHLLWRRRAALRRHWPSVLLVAAALIALNGPYVLNAFGAVADRLGGAVRTGYPQPTPRAVALVGPLMSGRLLGGADLSKPGAISDRFPSIDSLARLASCVIYPLVWIGIGVAGWRTYSRLRLRAPISPNNDTKGINDESARDAIAGIALAGLAIQVALAGLMRVPAHPQYFFGSFILHVMFAWLATDSLRHIRLRAPAIAAYGAGAACATLIGMGRYHGNDAFRGPMGPTLANQVEVAAALAEYDDPIVLTDVPFYQASARPLRSLRPMIRRDPARPARPAELLLIRYAPSPSRAGRIELVPAPALLPANARPMDVTPLRTPQ